MKTIFFCHDNQSNNRSRRNDLEAAGYNVKIAASGVELRRMLARSTPDLIVLDILLEGKDGFKVCSELHSLEADCPSIIILAGVYNRAGFRNEALRVGAKAYLPTELSFDGILETVARLIDEASGPRRAAA
jgi:CheY-like chemotaxis protein